MLQHFDPRRRTIGELVMPYLTVILTVILALTVWQTIENREFAHELRDAQIENCENSPVRKVLVEGLESELVSVNDPRIREAFPNVPKEVTDRLIREGNRRTRQRIGRLLAIDCEARYSP